MQSPEEFEPALFLAEVKEDVRSEISKAISRIESDLSQLPACRNGAVAAEALRQSCEKFKKFLALHFGKNMKKFEMYSEEYIFCESHTVSEKASPCAQLDIVQELRREFAEEKERYDTLSREKRELGALLKEMQSSLFDLRVSGQVLDSMNLQPLDDSVARLMQQVNQLTGLCSRADAINLFMKDDAMETDTISFPSEELIITGNIDDINLLSEQFES